MYLSDHLHKKLTFETYILCFFSGYFLAFSDTLTTQRQKKTYMWLESGLLTSFSFCQYFFSINKSFLLFFSMFVLLTVCFCKCCATICCKCLSEGLLVLLHGWNRNWGQIFALSFSLALVGQYFLYEIDKQILVSISWCKRYFSLYLLSL